MWEQGARKQLKLKSGGAGSPCLNNKWPGDWLVDTGTTAGAH